jgi:hypothetical protein
MENLQRKKQSIIKIEQNQYADFSTLNCQDKRPKKEGKKKRDLVLNAFTRSLWQYQLQIRRKKKG